MKKWKRFTSLLLFCLLIVSVLPAFAAETESVEKENIETESDEIAMRLEKAKELGLEEWVDSEGYLSDAFYEGRSDQILSEPGMEKLVRTMTEEELEAYVARLNAGINLLTVTYYEKVSQINPYTGRYLFTGVFEVDGILAYCIERSKSTPAKGAPTGEWIAVTNEKLRKVLYYGYNGPKDQGYTYVETALAAGEANGDGDNSLGRNVLAEIEVMASPPSDFAAWKVQTNGGETQDLAFYTITETGEAKIRKVSADPEMTTENENYSLAGAVYGIYSDFACKTEVGRLTTDATGTTETASLSPGTYYVKEITAPPGYLLSEEVNEVTVTAGQTATVSVTDRPETVIPDIIVQKQDSETGESKPQGDRTFENAQFLVKFFCGDYEEGENPESEDAVPDKQWTFATDAEGKIRFHMDYLVSGDSFWIGESGNAVLPLGTITIQEIQPPEGYLINPEIFVQKLESGENELETVPVLEEAIWPRLPETGSKGNFILQMLGCICCLTIFMRKRGGIE